MLSRIEDLFNMDFETYNNSKDDSSYFLKLFNFALSKGYIGEQTYESYIKIISVTISRYVKTLDTEDDYASDLSLIRNKRVKRVVALLDRYFYTLEPYKALQILLTEGFSHTLENVLNYNEKRINEIESKIVYLEEKYVDLFEKYPLYKDSLKDFLDVVKANDNYKQKLTSPQYELIMGLYSLSINHNYDYLNEIINMIGIELSIINKFDKNDVYNIIVRIKNLQLLSPELQDKTLSDEIDDIEYVLKAEVKSSSNNLCFSLLNNYVYSTILENEELIINDECYKKVLERFIRENDIIDIIKNGKIKFTNDEIDYIVKEFVQKTDFNDMETIRKLV